MTTSAICRRSTSVARLRASGMTAWSVAVRSDGGARRRGRRRPGRERARRRRRAARRYRALTASSWAWNHGPGGSATAACRSRRQRATRSASGIVSASCRAFAVSETSNGLTEQRVAAERVCRPGVAGEHDDGVAFGEHDAFLDDEIHAVTDRVDEHHVGHPQRSERTRIVVADIE